MEKRLQPLTAKEIDQLERQREWVRDRFPSQAREQYETIDGKLALLERILEEELIEPHESWKLQSLGVAFGDALVQQLGLEWIAVENDHGRDPALCDPATTIRLFPLTTISKRIEDGEPVDVAAFFKKACVTVAKLRSELPGGLFH